jgi:hypothetical protein
MCDHEHFNVRLRRFSNGLHHAGGQCLACEATVRIEGEKGHWIPLDKAFLGGPLEPWEAGGKPTFPPRDAEQVYRDWLARRDAA